MSSPLKPILEADLHAFVDGFTTAERRVEIVTHLEADPEATRRMADWCAQNEAIRRALGKAISHPLPEFSLADEPCRLKQPKAEAKTLALEPVRVADGPVTLRRRPRTRWRWPPGAVAAMVLVGVVGGWLGANAWNNLRPPSLFPVAASAAAVDPSAAFAEDAIETYLSTAAGTQFPTELSPREKARLSSWLSRHLGETLALPDPAPLGYAIVSGRIVAGHAGVAAVLLLANATGEHLTLTVAHGLAEGGTHYHEDRGTGVVVWQVDGHTLALAGPAERARLGVIAQKIGAVPRLGETTL